jgi:hypothetical protein
MKPNELHCPQCGTAISITEALGANLREHYQQEYQALKLKNENELKLAKEHLHKERQELKTRFELMLKSETTKLAKDIKLELAAKVEADMKLLELRNQDMQKALIMASENELNLRKRAQELEDRERLLALQVQRTLDDERARIRTETEKRIHEELDLRTAEKDKQLLDLRKQIEDLRRKAGQGSQQTQGEILEITLEKSLRELFPEDEIQRVPTGQPGGDVIQKIKGPNGSYVGTIVWEAKRTKNWSDGWIAKLKNDQRSLSAEFAVLVSQALPKDLETFGHVGGIWVTNYNSFPGIAAMLRVSAIQIHSARTAIQGSKEKQQRAYEYLTSVQFHQRLEVIIESFVTMNSDLLREKRAFEKLWATREEQIRRVIVATAKMHGDLQGIVGVSLPPIQALEIEQPQGATA